MTIQEAKKKIQRAMDQDGPFTHNLIGMVINMVASEHGKAEANKLIDEFDISELYGIEKVETT